MLLLLLCKCVPLLLLLGEVKAPVLDDVQLGKCKRDDACELCSSPPGPRGLARRPLMLLTLVVMLLGAVAEAAK